MNYGNSTYSSVHYETARSRMRIGSIILRSHFGSITRFFIVSQQFSKYLGLSNWIRLEFNCFDSRTLVEPFLVKVVLGGECGHVNSTKCRTPRASALNKTLSLTWWEISSKVWRNPIIPPQIVPKGRTLLINLGNPVKQVPRQTQNLGNPVSMSQTKSNKRPSKLELVQVLLLANL